MRISQKSAALKQDIEQRAKRFDDGKQRLRSYAFTSPPTGNSLQDPWGQILKSKWRFRSEKLTLRMLARKVGSFHRDFALLT